MCQLGTSDAAESEKFLIRDSNNLFFQATVVCNIPSSHLMSNTICPKGSLSVPNAVLIRTMHQKKAIP